MRVRGLIRDPERGHAPRSGQERREPAADRKAAANIIRRRVDVAATEEGAADYAPEEK